MKLFVDTGAWFALNSRTDQNHQIARKFLERFKTEPVLLLTTDYVIDETLTLLRFKTGHREAVRFLDFLAGAASLARLWTSRSQVADAESMFRRFDDKMWSFTDCVSLAVMDSLGLEDVFSFDRNFAQYGKRLHP